MKDVYSLKYQDPDTLLYFSPCPIRETTKKVLDVYQFKDNAGKIIEWTSGQLEIIDCIVNRSAPDGTQRVQIKASTQYGKSLAVAAGVCIRSSLKPERWAIVAGTDEKAKIIMEYVIMLSLNNELLRTQLDPATPLDRLRMKRAADRLVFRRKGEVRVYSAQADRVAETSKALMGFGSPNIIGDEASLIGDVLQAIVLRMLGGEKDNFYVKIGNPFNRGHFYKTWMREQGNYYRIFIDYNRALDEGRYSSAFIEEMRSEAMFDIFYECRTPGEGQIDRAGWVQLLTEEEVRRAFVQALQPFGHFRLGIDVAGGGRNFSTMVLKSYNVLKKLYKRNQPDSMMFVGEVEDMRMRLGMRMDDLFLDKVGVGKGSYDRLNELGNEKTGYIVGVNAGDKATDYLRFYNKRAEMYWRLREWILSGGKLEEDPDWFQLTKIKYKIDSSGRVRIMTKEEMLRNGIDSPDVADAASLSFYSSEPIARSAQQQQVVTVDPSILDPYVR